MEATVLYSCLQNSKEAYEMRCHKIRQMWSWLIVLSALLCSVGVVGNTLPYGQVIYSAQVSQAEYTHDGGRFDLFLKAVPSGNITRLTNHQAHPKQNLGGAIREPLFSADGRQILFLANYANSSKDFRETMTGASPYPYALLNVWKITISPRSIAPLTRGELGWHTLSWSPNGRFFGAVYPSREGIIDQDTPIPDDICVYSFSNAKTRKIARVSKNVSDIFWSLDSQNVLFQLWHDPNLYTLPKTGGKPKILIKGKGERFGYSFSSDKRKLAFVQDNAVYISRANGSDTILAIQHSNDERNSAWTKPRWSETGNQLAAAEISHDAQSANYQTKLLIYDLASHRDKVVATLQHNVTNVVWSNDGKWLVAKTLESGNTEKPDPKTGWHTFNREGLLAVAVADGHVVTLKEPNEETKGLDWFETAK